MNLIVSEDRVKEILINDIAIHDEYIKYNAANNNIDILEDMSNLYTIDLNYFWFNEYRKKTELEYRFEIVKMAKQIVADYDAGKAKYSQKPRTINYIKPQKDDSGLVCYDETSFVSCCYFHAGLSSMYDKSCSGGTLITEIIDNKGEMWLLNDEGLKKAQPGDILIKANEKVTQDEMGTKINCSHAMIYIGDDLIAHASSPSGGIRIENLKNSFRWKDGKHFFVKPGDLIDDKDNKLNIELRPCIKEYEKEKTEFYVRKVDCGIQRILYNNNDLILPAELTEVDIDTKIDESIVRYNAIARDMNVSLYSYNNNDLETEWGDNTTDRLIKHHYENNTYNIKSSGLIDTETHMHTGKNITTIEKLRIDLIDGSWLFSECYYAEDSSFFPELNTANMDDMNHMFYNCPRITELDLSSYNTINVLDTSHMFDSCMNLKKLNLSNFNLIRTRNVDYMLMNCINLIELRLDNCNETTIKKIIESEYFPTNKIEDESGMKRKIYCKRENTVGLKAPQNWMFAYNINNDENNMVKYESEKGNLYIPEHMIEELNDILYLFIDYIDHNEDEMNMDIS